MKRWTLGFVFSSDYSHVLLIHKEHPEHQKGKWNGLGGKYEEHETAAECIAREVMEESSLDIPISNWRQIGIVHGDGVRNELSTEKWEMDVLTCVYLGSKDDAQTTTDEQVRWFSIDDFPTDKHNLRWLIPLCFDALRRDEIDVIDVRYTTSKRWR